MAVSVVLVYVAALAWQSSRSLGGVDLGFNPVRLMAADLPRPAPPTAATVEERMIETQLG